MLRVEGKLRFWEDGHAVLCATCRAAWWQPFQLELPGFSDLELSDLSEASSAYLSAEAPLAAQPVPLTASWPRNRSRVERDRRLSALWR